MAAANGFVAFDIETDGLWNTETDTPPSILCAVTMPVTRIGPGLFQCEKAIHWTDASGEFMVRTQINEFLTIWRRRRALVSRADMEWMRL